MLIAFNAVDLFCKKQSRDVSIEESLILERVVSLVIMLLVSW